MVAGTGEYNAPLAVQGHGSAAFQQLGGVFRAYQNRQIQRQADDGGVRIDSGLSLIHISLAVTEPDLKSCGIY